jgi:coenzyme F420-reducing hydrogenase beta subunit
MEEDIYGYIYPKINKEDCINCGLCKKICPSINRVKSNKPIKAYAMWNLDNKKRSESTSGGVASIFSEYILENGGTVYGAAFEGNCIIKHIRITTLDLLYKLKGSKYVHSYIQDCYKMVKKDLNSGKKVLFTGTPCQIAGLNSFLRLDYDNLYTVDIVCHGVPSQKILQDEIKLDIKNLDVDNISFRDSMGFNLKLYKNNNILFNSNQADSLYYRGFMESLFYRENCYNCPYANENRVSDITIGDFWGIGKKISFTGDTDKGISLVMPITKKGVDLIDKCKENMHIEERPLDEAIDGNSQLRVPSIRHKNNQKFRDYYVKNGYYKACYQSLKHEIIIYKIKKSIKKILPYKILQSIRK